jgi:hypothetical protein
VILLARCLSDAAMAIAITILVVTRLDAPGHSRASALKASPLD